MITMGSAQEFALLRLDGPLDATDAIGLRDALENLDSEPAIIVALSSHEIFDRTIVEVLTRADYALAGKLIVVLPDGLGNHATLRIAPSLADAIDLARTLRDIAAASFSRDGVITDAIDPS